MFLWLVSSYPNLSLFYVFTLDIILDIRKSCEYDVTSNNSSGSTDNDTSSKTAHISASSSSSATAATTTSENSSNSNIFDTLQRSDCSDSSCNNITAIEKVELETVVIVSSSNQAIDLSVAAAL